jgi:hypothetical protein
LKSCQLNEEIVIATTARYFTRGHYSAILLY